MKFDLKSQIYSLHRSGEKNANSGYQPEAPKRNIYNFKQELMTNTMIKIITQKILWNPKNGPWYCWFSMLIITTKPLSRNFEVGWFSMYKKKKKLLFSPCHEEILILCQIRFSFFFFLLDFRISILLFFFFWINLNCSLLAWKIWKERN